MDIKRAREVVQTRKKGKAYNQAVLVIRQARFKRAWESFFMGLAVALVWLAWPTQSPAQKELSKISALEQGFLARQSAFEEIIMKNVHNKFLQKRLLKPFEFVRENSSNPLRSNEARKQVSLEEVQRVFTKDKHFFSYVFSKQSRDTAASYDFMSNTVALSPGFDIGSARDFWILYHELFHVMQHRLYLGDFYEYSKFFSEHNGIFLPFELEAYAFQFTAMKACSERGIFSGYKSLNLKDSDSGPAALVKLEPLYRAFAERGLIFTAANNYEISSTFRAMVISMYGHDGVNIYESSLQKKGGFIKIN